MVFAETLLESMDNTGRPPGVRLLRLVMCAQRGIAVCGDYQMIDGVVTRI
jgi:hypothetical protein